MIREFSKLDKILLALVAVGGSAMLLFPVQSLLMGLIGLIILVYLLLNPKHCFYLMLILSTYVPAFATESQQMPFNQTDILITICFFSVLCRFIFIDNVKVNLRTKIDIWLIVLLILYFFSGITSISHRGYQGFLRFGEAIAVFYMTVYFLRTRIIKLSELIKLMVGIGLFQALYGILQSTTGSFGANFRDNRGYLGYLGIGSSAVWHGQGTLGHFNCLGAFLSTLLLFFIPIYNFIIKNKTKGKIVIFILLAGIITSYSRNALICMFAGLSFFFYYKTENKLKFSIILTSMLTFILLAYNFLKNTSYVSTLSPRNDAWIYSKEIITSNLHNLLLGTGLKSSSDVLSAYAVNGFAYLHTHNLYLSICLEMGIIGLIFMFIFLISNLINACKAINTNSHHLKILGLSIALYIFGTFVLGVFDDTFEYFYTQIWLYIILGLLYAKNYKLYKNII